MEKVTRLQSFLNSQEVADLKDDIDFFQAVQEAKNFLKKLGKEGLINLLPTEKKDRLIFLIDEVEDCTKNYIATKNNSLCLAINHYISEGYDLLFDTIEDFEKKFINRLEEINSKITAVDTDLKLKNIAFEQVNKELGSSKEQAEKAVRHIEEQLKNATDIVSKWHNKVTKEAEDQISAKRHQIDKDISAYKIEVQRKFDDLLKGFEDFKQRQINEFEKVNERRKEFIDMYEIGVKYSKDARFDEYSSKEQKTADMFRWLSLALMVLVVFAIAFLTYETMKPDLSRKENVAFAIFSMLSRFLLVFSLMIPAIYASRESSRHRRNSDKYAQMANELKAFEIAIRTEDMKQENKERIKEEIFKRYFGNIFADNFVDKNISEDMISVGRILRPRVKQKDKGEK